MEDRKPKKLGEYSADLSTIKNRLWAVFFMLILLAIIGMADCSTAGQLT